MKKKMNVSIRKAAALALGLVLAVCASVPAFAANSVPVAPGYPPIAGDSAHGFRQYLVINSGARIPAVEFAYSIAPGQAAAASDGNMEILAGVGQPTVGKAVFTEGEETSFEPAAGLELDDFQEYAVRTVNFDFSGVQFTEPGIYRYIVTMTSAGQQAVDYDVQRSAQTTAKKRVLDVYVLDDDYVLKIDSYAFHELEDAVPAGSQGGSASVSAQHARLADKSEGFVNGYATQNLRFGKKIAGNQGAKDKYFAFTLSITSAAPNATYMVDLAGAEDVSGNTDATRPSNRAKTNPAQFTTDSNGAATVNYYITDGQFVKVQGLPRGCSYELTEDKEDYVSTVGLNISPSRGDADNSARITGTIADADIKTGFTNTREGIVPTGIMMAAGPAAGIFALGGAGLAGFIAVKRRRSGEDEAV